MIARQEFPSIPPEADRLVWCDWLRHHTIDPNQVVALDGFIEVDSDARQIRYLAYNLNAEGNKFVDPNNDERASMSVRVLQLEARPSSFPQLASGR